MADVELGGGVGRDGGGQIGSVLACMLGEEWVWGMALCAIARMAYDDAA